MENRAAVESDWPELLTFLPADLEATAKETGALIRKRGLDSAASLLRLALAYGYCGLSLRGTATWARETGIARLSAPALYQRLRKAADWLGRLVLQQLEPRVTRLPEVRGGRRLRVFDATALSRQGSKGSDFRVHLGLDLRTLTLDEVEVTTVAKGGETLKRFTFRPGDVALGDRGYAHRQGIAAAVAQDADVVVGFNGSAVPLQQPDGEPFDLFAALRGLQSAQAGEWAVRTAPAADGTPAVAGRLVALRRSQKAAEEARRKLRAKARKKGRTPDARSLEAAGYVLLFTTLAQEQAATEQVLELYRFRWQIELAFKRMKSLIALDEMAAKDEELCRTFILAKLLATLLIEDLCHRWVDFSPGATEPPRPVSLWRAMQRMAATLRQAIGAALKLHDWRERKAALGAALRDEPRQRPSQAAAAMRFAARWAASSSLC